MTMAAPARPVPAPEVVFRHHPVRTRPLEVEPLTAADFEALMTATRRWRSELDRRDALPVNAYGRGVGRDAGRRLTAARAQQLLEWAVAVLRQVTWAERDYLEDEWATGGWGDLLEDLELLIDTAAAWLEFWSDYRGLRAGLPTVALLLAPPAGSDLHEVDRPGAAPGSGRTASREAVQLVAAPGAPGAGRLPGLDPTLSASPA